MSQRAKLIEIESRSIVASKKDNDIYHNGIDNDYPERIERIINNSVTAKLCVNKMKQYLYGKGIAVNPDYIINSKGKTLDDLLEDLANEVPFQKSFAIHCNYDVDYKINTFDFIRVKKVRISKEDLFDNAGLIYVSDNWEGGNLRSKKTSKGRKFYYPFNPNSRAIDAQRQRDYENYLLDNDIKESSLSIEQIARIKLEVYRGQVLYVNLDNQNVYPNAYIDPAYNDADTEYRIANFRNKQVRDGFIGSTIFSVLDQGDQSQELVTDKDLKALCGSDNAHKILKISVSANQNGDLSEAIKATTIKSDIDTDRFQYDEKKIEEHILNCFSVPKVLVMNSDNSIFGNSGEAFKVAQEIYNDETFYERRCIEKALNKILSYIENPFRTSINDMFGSSSVSSSQTEDSQETAEDQNKIAQATLRGSVGGVTALLQIQQSVANGITDLSAGIAIIKNIYGFNEDQAREMLGTPEEINPLITTDVNTDR